MMMMIKMRRKMKTENGIDDNDEYENGDADQMKDRKDDDQNNEDENNDNEEANDDNNQDADNDDDHHHHHGTDISFTPSINHQS